MPNPHRYNIYQCYYRKIHFIDIDILIKWRYILIINIFHWYIEHVPLTHSKALKTGGVLVFLLKRKSLWSILAQSIDLNNPIVSKIICQANAKNPFVPILCCFFVLCYYCLGGFFNEKFLQDYQIVKYLAREDWIAIQTRTQVLELGPRDWSSLVCPGMS